MRDLKIVTTTIASLVLAVLLGSAGCSEDQDTAPTRTGTASPFTSPR